MSFTKIMPFRTLRLFLVLWGAMVCGRPAMGIDQGCFEFRDKKPQSLREPIALKTGTDHGESGELDHGVVWGAARGIVKKPIQFIYKQFLGHEIVKDMTKTELSVKSEEAPGYLELHRVKLKVNPVSFITIRWTEEWAYLLEKGTAKAPKQIRMFYQKEKGTRYIQHQCGEFVIKSVDANTTDVYLYEQVRATRRTGNATMKMHLSTLNKLRKAK